MKTLGQLIVMAQGIDEILKQKGLNSQEVEFIGHIISMANQAGMVGIATVKSMQKEGLIP